MVTDVNPYRLAMAARHGADRVVDARTESLAPVMAELGISRGNANTNLRDLVGWGLIRKVVRVGERREFFEAEKDVWRIFCTVARERRRREVLRSDSTGPTAQSGRSRAKVVFVPSD